MEFFTHVEAISDHVTYVENKLHQNDFWCHVLNKARQSLFGD